MELIVSTGIEPVPGYRFLRKLGQGGFGEVWEVEAPGGVRVAIKVIRVETERSKPELRALDLIRNIRHPHLLDVQFSVSVGDCLLIAMPLCDRSLWDRYNECREREEPGIPLEELIVYMQELAKAVDFLNEPRHMTGDGQRFGIQHRDIKPHNIFLVGGSTRLADFGLAKILGESLASHTGSMSPHYVSPEALEGRVAPQSDQYSLAVTYHQLRCGLLPNPGKHINEIIYNRMSRQADVSALPESERPTLSRALARDPDDRFPTCHAFVTSLCDAIWAGGNRGSGPGKLGPGAIHGLGQATTTPMTVHAYGLPGSPGVEGDPQATVPPVGAHLSNAATQRGLGDFDGPPPQASPIEPAREPVAEVIVAGPPPPRRHPWLTLAGAAVLAMASIIAAVPYFPKPNRDAPRGSGVKPDVPKTPPTVATTRVAGRPPESTGPDAIADARTPNTTHAPPPDSRIRPPIVERRPARSDYDVLNSIRDHLRKTEVSDRRFQRYFSLLALNNRRELSADELMLGRAAVSKLVNSLSGESAIVVPLIVDADGIVLNVDLRRLGWAKDNLWEEVLRQYPYGLNHVGEGDPLRQLDEEVRSLSGEDLPSVRADWFVASASRPPLYQTLLRLPGNARDLETRLGIDAKADFLGDRVARAGSSKGGVSAQPQVFERNLSSRSAYWRTYDFRPEQRDGMIDRRPLGPSFEGNPFPQQAFEHSGGEILFGLPNGFLGYLLVDAEGTRVDTMPMEIAIDPLQSAGTSELVNGLSCLACHKRGVLPLRDEIRDGSKVTGEARRKVEAVYPGRAEMETLRAGDEQRFLTAARAAMDPFLKAPGNKIRDLGEIPEPIGALASRYNEELDAEDLARELGIGDVMTLGAKIRAITRPGKLGLEPLLSGKTISRELLRQSFDLIAIEFDLGTPHRNF